MTRAVATIVAVMMLCALSIGRAKAGSDKVSCQSKSSPVTKMNADGTECDTMVFGSGANKATAHASGMGVAKASAGNGSTIFANATNQGHAIMDVAAGLGSAIASGSGAMATLDVTQVGGGKAIAKGTNSVANSEITSANGGLANSNASGGSVATADVLSTGSITPFGNGGTAIANASKGSSATAKVQMTGGGKANATSSGSGAQAEAIAETTCKAQSTSKGTSSIASAQCQNSGTVVTVEATNGSTAIGSDSSPPTCTPMNGGIAKVRSPMGNCP
jgi:hypothetical protein